MEPQLLHHRWHLPLQALTEHVRAPINWGRKYHKRSVGCIWHPHSGPWFLLTEAQIIFPFGGNCVTLLAYLKLSVNKLASICWKARALSVILTLTFSHLNSKCILIPNCILISLTWLLIRINVCANGILVHPIRFWMPSGKLGCFTGTLWWKFCKANNYPPIDFFLCNYLLMYYSCLKQDTNILSFGL